MEKYKKLYVLFMCSVLMVFIGCPSRPGSVEHCPKETTAKSGKIDSSSEEPALDELEKLRKSLDLIPALGQVEIIDGIKWLVLEMEPDDKILFQPMPLKIDGECKVPEEGGKWIIFRGPKPIALQLSKDEAFFWTIDEEMDCLSAWNAVPDPVPPEEEPLVVLEASYFWEFIPEYDEEGEGDIKEPPKPDISEKSMDIDVEPGIEKIRLAPDGFEILSEKGEMLLRYPTDWKEGPDSLVVEDCGTSYNSDLLIQSFGEKGYIIDFTLSNEIVSGDSECTMPSTETSSINGTLGPIQKGQFKSYHVRTESGGNWDGGGGGGSSENEQVLLAFETDTGLLKHVLEWSKSDESGWDPDEQGEPDFYNSSTTEWSWDWFFETPDKENIILAEGSGFEETSD